MKTNQGNYEDRLVNELIKLETTTVCPTRTPQRGRNTANELSKNEVN